MTLSEVHKSFIDTLEAAYHELKSVHGYNSMEDMVDKIWSEIKETGWNSCYAIIARKEKD